MKQPSKVLCGLAFSIPLLLLLLPEEPIKAKPWEKFSWKKTELPIDCQTPLLKDGFYEANDGDYFFEFYHSLPHSFYMSENHKEIPYENLFCYSIMEPSNIIPVE